MTVDDTNIVPTILWNKRKQLTDARCAGSVVRNALALNGSKETMAKQKYKMVRVTMTRDYFVPVQADGSVGYSPHSTLDSQINEWFFDYPPYESHATRDSSRIGNSERFVSYEALDKDFEM